MRQIKIPYISKKPCPIKDKALKESTTSQFKADVFSIYMSNGDEYVSYR